MAGFAAVFAPAPLVANWKHLTSSWKSVANGEYELRVLTCDKFLYGNCLTIKALSVENASTGDYHLMCSACRFSAKFSQRIGQMIELGKYLDATDRLLVETLLGGAENLASLTFEGLEVGRLAAFDELMRQKTSPSQLRITDAYVQDVRNFLLTYLATKAYLGSEEISWLGVNNGAYSVNRAAAEAASSLDIEVKYMLAGGSPANGTRSFYIFPDVNHYRKLATSTEWSEASQIALKSRQISKIELDLTLKIMGSAEINYSANSIHSQDRELEATLRSKRSEGKKVAFVPLTSPDEFSTHDFVFGGENLKWKQEEWIERIMRWADELQDWVFVFRPHPRMFPNPREKVTSPLAARLLHMLDTSSVNVLINDPRNGNSAYRIAQFADVVLGYRSSLPLELMALGVPTLTLDPGEVDAYPALNSRKLLTSAQFQQEAFEYMSIPNSFFVRHAFRWLFFLNFRKVWEVKSSREVESVELPRKFRQTRGGKMARLSGLRKLMRDIIRRSTSLVGLYNLVRVAIPTAEIASPPSTLIGGAPKSDEHELYDLNCTRARLIEAAGWHTV